MPPGPTPSPPSPLRSLTCGALAEEGVGLVDTLAVVQAGAAGALVRIDLAEIPLVAWPISKGGPGGRRIGDARLEALSHCTNVWLHNWI